ncbi:hypothetical protein O9993_00425 [Vibrio lentus]|nr:hypothetical protein [Vibrio lentus]
MRTLYHPDMDWFTLGFSINVRLTLRT